jgi:hypothetical protein
MPPDFASFHSGYERLLQIRVALDDVSVRIAAEQRAMPPERSAEFRRWWPRQEVAGPASWRKTINHPQAGTIVFNYAALRADDAQGGLQVVIYTPVADGISPQRLMTLVAAKPRRAAPR